MQPLLPLLIPQRPLFAFTIARLQGLHVCDVIDIFADWQQKSGSRDMQLLMLVLLDKEQEMPGVWGFTSDTVIQAGLECAMPASAELGTS